LGSEVLVALKVDQPYRVDGLEVQRSKGARRARQYKEEVLSLIIPSSKRLCRDGRGMKSVVAALLSGKGRLPASIHSQRQRSIASIVAIAKQPSTPKPATLKPFFDLRAG
jgi:hypothetical protein